MVLVFAFSVRRFVSKVTHNWQRDDAIFIVLLDVLSELFFLILFITIDHQGWRWCPYCYWSGLLPKSSKCQWLSPNWWCWNNSHCKRLPRTQLPRCKRSSGMLSLFLCFLCVKMPKPIGIDLDPCVCAPWGLHTVLTLLTCWSVV